MTLLELALLLQDSGAPAGDTPPAAGSSWMRMLMPMILIVVIFYVIMIGPERKQRRRREEMLSKLEKGDKVMTTGGLHGTVAQVQDQVVTLQVADGVRLRYSLSSVQQRFEDVEPNPAS